MVYFPQTIHPQEGFAAHKNLLKTVGKEAVSPHTLYMNDYESGNAVRHTSRLPDIRNGGFGVPFEYSFFPVPKYTDPYVMSVRNEPRTSEINRGSYNDPVHMYFQNLYGAVEDAN